MEQFRIKQNGFKEISKENGFNAIQAVLLLILTVLVFGCLRGQEPPKNLKPLFVFISIFGAMAALIFYWSVRRQKKLVESYTLTFEDQLIIREQYDTPTVSLLFNEVSKSEEMQTALYNKRKFCYRYNSCSLTN